MNIETIEQILVHRPKVIGTSKSVKELAAYLGKHEYSVLVLNLEDFRLSDLKIKKRNKKYKTRYFSKTGVPGTHRVRLLSSVLRKLIKGKKVKIPVGDGYKKITTKYDFIILKGKIVGQEGKPFLDEYVKPWKLIKLMY